MDPGFTKISLDVEGSEHEKVNNITLTVSGSVGIVVSSVRQLYKRNEECFVEVKSHSNLQSTHPILQGKFSFCSSSVSSKFIRYILPCTVGK